MTRTIRDERADRLQGGRAGFVSRVAADAIDFLVVEVIYVTVLVGVAVVRFLISRRHFSVGAPDLVVTVAAQWVILVLYLGTGWSSTGRTIGKSVLGLRVCNLDGTTVGTARAFARSVLCATVYPALLWIFVSRTNAALHDVILRTQVLYDWRGSVPMSPLDAP